MNVSWCYSKKYTICKTIKTYVKICKCFLSLQKARNTINTLEIKEKINR